MWQHWMGLCATSRRSQETIWAQEVPHLGARKVKQNTASWKLYSASGYYDRREIRITNHVRLVGISAFTSRQSYGVVLAMMVIGTSSWRSLVETFSRRRNLAPL